MAAAGRWRRVLVIGACSLLSSRLSATDSEGGTHGSRPAVHQDRPLPAAAEPKTFEAWLALGTLRRSQEEFFGAEDALKNALALKPDDFEAQRELAMLEQEMGRDEAAADRFERLIKKNPRDHDLHIHLARSDMRLGRFTEAQEEFARAKMTPGKTADDYIAQGYSHINAGESTQAETSFESAIAVDTASPLGYHHMAAYLVTQRRYPEAEKYFRQALEKLEANPKTRTDDILHTLNRLASVIQIQGRSAEAEAVYSQCLANPSPSRLYVDCLRSLGKMEAAQGKNAQAEDVFKRAAAACAEDSGCACRGNALVGLAEFDFARGRQREASSTANQAGKLCAVYSPADFFVLMSLAGLQARLGEIPRAEALYGQIIAAGQPMALNDAVPLARRNLADLEMAQGRFPEAEELYRRAIAAFDNHHDGQQEADTLERLAIVCEKEGKPQEAAGATVKAKELRGGPSSKPRGD